MVAGDLGCAGRFLITYPIAGWLGATSLTLAAIALAAIATVATGAAIGFAARANLRTDSDVNTHPELVSKRSA